MTTKEKGIITKLRGHVRSVSQKCYNPDCQNLAIRSHILQKNGILNTISKEGFLYQLAPNDLFKVERYRFQHASIAGGDVLTFWGFCKDCDDKIFRAIEKTPPDFTDRHHLLLFSYRALLKEQYKRDYQVKLSRSIIDHKEIGRETREFYRQELFNHEFVSKVNFNFKELIEKDLTNKSNNIDFIFHVLRIRACPVATSAMYSLPQRISGAPEDFKKGYKEDFFKKHQQNIFIHLIPNNKDTVLVIGHSSTVSNIEMLSVQELYSSNEKIKILISEILIKLIETWCISIPFFLHLKRNGKDIRILKIKNERLYSNVQKFYTINYNIFEDFE